MTKPLVRMSQGLDRLLGAVLASMARVKAEQSPEQQLDTLMRSALARTARGGFRLAERVRQHPGYRSTRSLLRERTHSRIGFRTTKRALARPAPETHELLQSIAAFRAALLAGAYETALELAQAALPRLAAAPASVQAQVRALMTELLVAMGPDERALGLGAAYGTAASAAHRGADGASASRPLAHASSPARVALNPYLLSRAIEDGSLDPRSLCRLYLANPLEFCRNPELELVLFNAKVRCQGARDMACLARFLDWHGLPQPSLTGTTDNLLCDLRFSGSAHEAVDGPLVSVLLSAFRARTTVRYAADSILLQTYRNIELLICDDASDDGTFEHLTQCYGHEPRVKLYRSRSNQGTYNARNQLIAEARGDLLTFQDADDLSLPTRIADQVKALASSRAEACVTNMVRVRPDGAFLFHRDRRACRMCLVTLMASRELFRRVGPYRSARFGADLELYDRLLASVGSERVARIKRPHVFGLWSSGSLTRVAGAETLENGYRSPARRLYTELAYRQRTHGKGLVSDAEIDAQLQQTGNYARPSGLIPSGSRPAG